MSQPARSVAAKPSDIERASEAVNQPLSATRARASTARWLSGGAAKTLLLFGLLATCVAPAWAQNESKQFAAKNGAFTFSAPSAFKDIGDAPASALVALEVPGFGVSFLSERQKAEEVEADAAQTQAKKKLTESGAKILGSAKANLAGKPAFSLLVGGVKQGKESLFVYNLRADYWYVFVLNYPEGQRKDAADLWQLIAPSIKFKS